MTYTTEEEFERDLIRADKTETHFAELLASDGYVICETEEANPFYDIRAKKDGKTFTYELKEDLQTSTTGNVAVEVSKEINGETKESGLSISTSDYFVYKISKGKFFKYYFIDTKILRQNISDFKFKVIKGGDGNRSNLVLIPEDLFYSFCDSAKTIVAENKEIVAAINKIKTFMSRNYQN